jgi:hypothetical protein
MFHGVNTQRSFASRPLEASWLNNMGAPGQNPSDQISRMPCATLWIYDIKFLNTRMTRSRRTDQADGCKTLGRPLTWAKPEGPHAAGHLPILQSPLFCRVPNLYRCQNFAECLFNFYQSAKSLPSVFLNYAEY